MSTQHLLRPSDSDYPPGLHDLEEPPQLWVMGEMSDVASVAVVGTRRCTRYGFGLAEAFGAAIGRAGWIICGRR